MLGRSDDADLVVSDISISRKHAMIVNRFDGFRLSDLASTNGCWVNREKVVEPVKLEEDDKVTLDLSCHTLRNDLRHRSRLRVSP